MSHLVTIRIDIDPAGSCTTSITVPPNPWNSDDDLRPDESSEVILEATNTGLTTIVSALSALMGVVTGQMGNGELTIHTVVKAPGDED